MLSSWPFFDEEQIEAVTKILLSGKVNAFTGSQTKIFEEKYSKFFGSKYSIAVSNGTVALATAYNALNLKAGDEFITTPRTFIATSSAGLILGAKPVFADVDKNSGCITASTIEPLINKKTKAISVVHLGGWPADMPKIVSLAKEYNIPIIEDCSQAHGATINKQHVGTFGDIATWSFCNDKIITTGGEGGMITTSNPLHYEFIRSYKDHGKNLSLLEEDYKGPTSFEFKWLHENIGTNFRLTEMQSALGIIQLKRLPDWIKIRRRNAEILIDSLQDLENIRIPTPPSNYQSAWYKFYCYINKNALLSDWNRGRILQEINAKGFPAFSGSCSEIYLEKCFLKSSFGPYKRLPIAKELGEQSLMFLIHPTISSEQMNNYASCIKSVLNMATR